MIVSRLNSLAKESKNLEKLKTKRKEKHSNNLRINF